MRFDTLTDDLRALLRQVHGRDPESTACVLDSRTMQSTPKSGARAAYDAGKRRKGTKVHLAVDTLGHPLAVHAIAADEQDRAHVAPLPEKVQDVTGAMWNRRTRMRAIPGTMLPRRPPRRALNWW